MNPEESIPLEAITEMGAPLLAAGGPAGGGFKNSRRDMVMQMGKHIRDFGAAVHYPCHHHLGQRAPLTAVIMHLNDLDRWSRERIGDWVDRIAAEEGLDLEVHMDEVSADATPFPSYDKIKWAYPIPMGGLAVPDEWIYYSAEPIPIPMDFQAGMMSTKKMDESFASTCDSIVESLHKMIDALDTLAMEFDSVTEKITKTLNEIKENQS